MYYHLGKMLVLQPDPALRFVREPEAHHPMLPQGAGLYTLRAPGTSARALARSLTLEAQQRWSRTVSFAADKLDQAVSNIQPAAGLRSSGEDPRLRIACT